MMLKGRNMDYSDLRKQWDAMVSASSDNKLSEDGASLSSAKPGIAFCLGPDTYIYGVKLWDGVYIWANQINISRIDYAVDAMDTEEAVLINLCHSGRCEVAMKGNSFIYMTPGILNTSVNKVKRSFLFPGGSYDGVEMLFDMKRLKDKMPAALEEYGFDYGFFDELYKRENLLAKVSADSLNMSVKLFKTLCSENYSTEDVRFEVLSLLHCLWNGGASEIEWTNLVSKGQRRIACEVERIITEDLSKRHTIDQLASRVGVGASAMKKYFVAVYGKPISYYLRDKRIEKAKALLTTSDLSIGAVAAACGYEHQGKFGSVFKAAVGMAPLEFRRCNNSLGR